MGEYITANEVNLCLAIQTFQETVHSQSYSYMLDTICEPQERNDVLYQWKEDEHLLARNEFIGNLYNQFQDDKSPEALARVLVANYILEGVYFYSGFMFFYNLGRNNLMPGSDAGDPLHQPRREHAPVAVPQHPVGTERGRAGAVHARAGGGVPRHDQGGLRARDTLGHYAIGDEVAGSTSRW